MSGMENYVASSSGYTGTPVQRDLTNYELASAELDKSVEELFACLNTLESKLTRAMLPSTPNGEEKAGFPSELNSDIVAFLKNTRKRVQASTQKVVDMINRLEI